MSTQELDSFVSDENNGECRIKLLLRIANERQALVEHIRDLLYSEYRKGIVQEQVHANEIYDLEQEHERALDRLHAKLAELQAKLSAAEDLIQRLTVSTTPGPAGPG